MCVSENDAVPFWTTTTNFQSLQSNRTIMISSINDDDSELSVLDGFIDDGPSCRSIWSLLLLLLLKLTIFLRGLDIMARNIVFGSNFEIGKEKGSCGEREGNGFSNCEVKSSYTIFRRFSSARDDYILHVYEHQHEFTY